MPLGPLPIVEARRDSYTLGHDRRDYGKVASYRDDSGPRRRPGRRAAVWRQPSSTRWRHLRWFSLRDPLLARADASPMSTTRSQPVRPLRRSRQSPDGILTSAVDNRLTPVWGRDESKPATCGTRTRRAWALGRGGGRRLERPPRTARVRAARVERGSRVARVVCVGRRCAEPRSRETMFGLGVGRSPHARPRLRRRKRAFVDA